MKFFKSFTGQLMLGGAVTITIILSFSIYFFVNIKAIAKVQNETHGVIDDVPSALFVLQSNFLVETNLLSAFHHGFISQDAFSAQIEEVEKREDEHYEKLTAIQERLGSIVFLSKEEEVFSGQFKPVLDGLNTARHAIEEKIKAMADARAAYDEAGEVAALNDIAKSEAEVEKVLFSTDIAVSAILAGRYGYINTNTEALLKNSFFFMVLLLVIIIGANLYLIMQTVFSLRAILKGIASVKSGNLAYRVKLYSDNEFGIIAAAFNRATAAIEMTQEKLQATTQQAQEQAKELAEKNSHLERFQKITVGRELKMIELKKELENMKHKA